MWIKENTFNWGRGMLGWVVGPMLTMALLGLGGCHAAKTQPASAAMAPGVAGGVREIHVDGSCRVLPDGAGAAVSGEASGQSSSSVNNPANSSAKQEPGSELCRLVGGRTSQHVESGVRKDSSLLYRVTVTEQYYLLRNVTATPVTFVLEYAVAKGWEIDTDSPPTQMVGATAIFRAPAEPGQSVRLQVGERHVVALTGTLKDDELGK